MASEWARIKLSDLTTKIGSGATPSGGKEVYKTEGINLIRSQNVYNLRFEPSGIAYIDKEQADGLSNVILESQDLLLNITGDSVARCCQVPENYLPARVNQHVAIIRVYSEKLDSRYLLYHLTSPEMQSYMLGVAGGGATRNALTKSMIEAFEIPLPPLPIQRQIASILSAFDDKIELNRQINRTLEQMARALFKSWFVDFDPVRAKMRGEQPEGMDAATAALFPSELVEVDGREVPKGWEWGTVGDIANQWKGQINPSQHPDSTFAHFSIPAFDAGKQPIIEKGESIKSNKFTVPDGAILVSKLNPSTPRIWDVEKPEDVDFSVCSTEFIPFVAKQSEYVPLLFLALSSKTFVQALADQASGTSNSHQRVKPADIGNAPVALPSEAVISAFGKLTLPILGSIKHNIQESARLASLRDALLPRLL